ncbi:MAG TPA: NAD(P)/FAD-dependent oxidoreductase [Caulobacterales bacterium]|nr:NAD(P)/FAD-dependent oxidoreductase [Caulobacterales bacterium]
MRRRLDIAIAGCGVAGLSCAALLGRAGHRVLVFDKLDAPQPIGSGLVLQPVGLAVLDEIGIGARMRALGAPLHRLFGRAAPSQRIVLDVRYSALGRDAPNGLAVHRGALFSLLLNAAQEAGAEIVTRREVVGVETGALAFAHGEQVGGFDLVIDALGMRSPLNGRTATPLQFGALWASLDWAGDFDPHTLEQRYERARKMAGVLPIGRLDAHTPMRAAFFWSLKGEAYDAWRAAPLNDWKDEVRGLWPATEPYLVQLRTHDDLVFARYAHRTLASPCALGLAHVGDSWHCASPQLGQGANMALLDALALARALEANADIADALGAYACMRLWHIRLYQAASFLFTPAYQSDSVAIAWLRDWIMAPLSRAPPAPALLAGLVAGAWGAPLRAISAHDLAPAWPKRLVAPS